MSKLLRTSCEFVFCVKSFKVKLLFGRLSSQDEHNMAH